MNLFCQPINYGQHDVGLPTRKRSSIGPQEIASTIRNSRGATMLHHNHARNIIGSGIKKAMSSALSWDSLIYWPAVCLVISFCPFWPRTNCVLIYTAGMSLSMYTRHRASESENWFGMGRKRVSDALPHQKAGKSKGKCQSPFSISTSISRPSSIPSHIKGH